MTRAELPERIETDRLVLRNRTVADAEDIYAEIDRVLEASRAVSDHYGQGVTAIRAELKRRGELSSYQDYFAQEKPQENSEPSSLMQQLLSQPWEQFFEKSKEIFSSH